MFGLGAQELLLILLALVYIALVLYELELWLRGRGK